MNLFSMLWQEILCRPILNVLILFLAIFGGNLGIAIILLTLLVRFLLLKNTLAGANMQKGMSNIQPKMEEIQKKYKEDPKKLSEETMKLLKKEGSGPLKGCLSMLIQMPVFIGLYFVVKEFTMGEVPTDWLYSFFWSFGNPYMNAANIEPTFLGINLFEKGSLVLTIAVALFNFIQFQLTNITQKANKPAIPMGGEVKMPDMSKMMGMMSIMMTVMMASLVWSFPSAIWLYLLTTSVFSVVQYSIQYRVLLKAKLSLLFNKNKATVIEPK